MGLKDTDIVSRPIAARRSLLLALGGGIATALVGGIAGCASGSGRSDQDPSDPGGGGRGARQPGLYWGPGFGCPGGNCYDTTLTAYVGLPVEWTAWASCHPQGWNLSHAEISSGALPPGLYIGNNAQGNAAILGVPERAGTWHLQVRFHGVTCAGGTFNPITQTLHITTEGSSAPQRVR
jgi:hypothetical protein